ncbi:hypothetical protein C8R45DRAFT_973103 [Mycena sanguinolenta]|nr:hypothetical protein C8R45DRAFT_973103 [Mycena sanguinolenta]
MRRWWCIQECAVCEAFALPFALANASRFPRLSPFVFPVGLSIARRVRTRRAGAVPRRLPRMRGWGCDPRFILPPRDCVACRCDIIPLVSGVPPFHIRLPIG